MIELVEDRTAERVLSCINGERLRLLLALIRKPMSVTQMIQEMGYGSTGQAYHHLRMLQTADLVYEASEEEGRGVYAARPYRVQGILLLAGRHCGLGGRSIYPRKVGIRKEIGPDTDPGQSLFCA